MLRGACAVTALSVAGAAAAQPATADKSPAPVENSPAATNDSGLQEIVVTAQRHSQRLLSVPLSIEARTSAQLNASGIKDLTGLQFTSPGFVVADSDGLAQIYVRGVGNSIFVGADPSVTTYIDDVPRIYGSLVSALLVSIASRC